MELSPKQQIAELIKKNQNILILGHRNHGGDLVGSMLALEKVLVSQNKKVDVVLSESLDQTLLFLPGIDHIKKDVSSRDTVVKIDKAKHSIEKISYNEDDKYINIVLSPKGGVIESKDLVVTTGNFNYDLIIALDTPDVEKIDKIYDKHTELFFEVPIINIDHHSGNEYFGTVNLVDMTATSTAEILVSIIEAMGANNFDADVATCLLTGLIADTSSFKNTSTTPKSLTISAQMLAAGARQQEIIQNLYKTRPLKILKLWGKVLSNIEYDREHRMVVSFVDSKDLETAGVDPDAVTSVLDELLASAPGTDVVLILTEQKGRIEGFLKGLNGQDVLSLAEKFGGHGNALSATFMVPKATIDKDKEQIVNKVKDLRDSQLGKVATQASQKEQNGPADETISVQLDKETKEDEKVKIGDDIVVEVKLDADSVEDLNELMSLERAVEGETEGLSEDNLVSAFLDIRTDVDLTESDEKDLDSDDIEKALLSIDNEIETGLVAEPNETAPNIDIEGTKDKRESLRKLGEVMRGHTPGKALDEAGRQPIDPQIWK